MKPDRSAIYHRLFDLGIGLKGIDGVLESIGGAACLSTTRPMIIGVVVG